MFKRNNILGVHKVPDWFQSLFNGRYSQNKYVSDTSCDSGFDLV